MRKSIQKRAFAAVAFVGLCAVGLVARGGNVDTPSLAFNTCTNPTQVAGDLSAFRNNTTGNYAASCSLIASGPPSSIKASCTIANYNPANGGHPPAGSLCPGVHFTCTSQDLAIIDAVSTLQSSSHFTLNFSSTCASGGTCTCTSISVDNFSNDGILTF